MNAPEECAAARDAFYSEADGFVGAARSDVLRKNAKPNAVGISILKYEVNELGEKRPTMTEARTRNSHPLYERDLFGGLPIADNGEAD